MITHSMHQLPAYFFTSLLELVTHYEPPKLTDNNLCTVNAQKEGNLVATMVSGTLALIAQGLAPQTAGHITIATITQRV